MIKLPMWAVSLRYRPLRARWRCVGTRMRADRARARHRADKIERGRYRLDADLDRAGADDVDAGPGTFLRRHGAQEERAGDAHAELRDHLRGDHPVVADRLLLGIHARQQIHRRLQPRIVQRHGVHARPGQSSCRYRTWR